MNPITDSTTAADVRVGDTVRITYASGGIARTATFEVTKQAGGILYAKGGGVFVLQGSDSIEILDRPEPEVEPGMYVHKSDPGLFARVTLDGEYLVMPDFAGGKAPRSAHRTATEFLDRYQKLEVRS